MHKQTEECQRLPATIRAGKDKEEIFLRAFRKSTALELRLEACERESICVAVVYLGLPRWLRHLVKNLPAMQETQVQSLGREGPLEKGMATHSSFLAWRIPWTENPGRLQSMGSRRVGHDFDCYECIQFMVSCYTSPRKTRERKGEGRGE